MGRAVGVERCKLRGPNFEHGADRHTLSGKRDAKTEMLLKRAIQSSVLMVARQWGQAWFMVVFGKGGKKSSGNL